MKQRLLDTPQERIPIELVEQVRAFCEPLDVVASAYVGLIEIARGTGNTAVKIDGLMKLAAHLRGLGRDAEAEGYEAEAEALRPSAPDSEPEPVSTARIA